MKTLYVRIYLTMVAVLALFALVGGYIVHRNIEQERLVLQRSVGQRASAWAELIENSIPAATADPEAQRKALLDWSDRLHLALALDDAQGRRIATSELFRRREGESVNEPRRSLRVPLADGRVLWVAARPALFGPGVAGGRPPPMFGHEAPGGPGEPGGPGVAGGAPGGEGPQGVEGPGGLQRPRGPRPPGLGAGPIVPLGPLAPWFSGGSGLLVTLIVLFVAVAAGAYPVVRRLTRRLESLRSGVERFGSGQLAHRVAEDGSDEVAAVAISFNRAADRIEELVRANRSLLANASHELRSPLARLKMAVALMEDVGEPQRRRLKQEIDTNIAELDALVEEVLLASRLDASNDMDCSDRVDLLGVLAEEAARVGATADGTPVTVRGNERLLRRAARNLLENARRYGGSSIEATLASDGPRHAVLRVCDRGPGVPADMRERIFEPFFRMPGHAEREGGVGLGLSLVRQIAQRHGGTVRCETREGGGSCFAIRLPVDGAPA